MTAGELPAVSGIVLAGGRATRFGRDKLAEPLDGRPLIAHVLEAMAGVATEIVVAGGPVPAGSGPVHRGQHGIAIAIRSVADREPDGGPLVGVLAGLETAREPMALVVAGDMPRLVPAVLRLLVRSLAAAEPGDVDGSVLVHHGRIQPVPIAVRTGAGTSAAQRGLGHGSRSLHAWLDALRLQRLEEPDWRPLDPGAATLFDVDRVTDLDRMRR